MTCNEQANNEMLIDDLCKALVKTTYILPAKHDEKILREFMDKFDKILRDLGLKEFYLNWLKKQEEHGTEYRSMYVIYDKLKKQRGEE